MLQYQNGSSNFKYQRDRKRMLFFSKIITFPVNIFRKQLNCEKKES